jgi:hypothetical protein
MVVDAGSLAANMMLMLMAMKTKMKTAKRRFYEIHVFPMLRWISNFPW